MNWTPELGDFERVVNELENQFAQEQAERLLAGERIRVLEEDLEYWRTENAKAIGAIERLRDQLERILEAYPQIKEQLELKLEAAPD